MKLPAIELARFLSSFDVAVRESATPDAQSLAWEVLRRHELFAGLASASSTALVPQLRCSRTAAGAMLVQQDGLESHVRFLVSGFAVSYCLDPFGSRRVEAFFGPGFALNLERLAVSRCVSPQVEGLTRCVSIDVPVPLLAATVLGDVALAANLVRLLGAFIADARALRRVVTVGGAERRLANALLWLVDRLGGGPAEHGAIPFPLRRSDLADFIGAAESTVSRALADWARRGYVEVGRMRQAVLNRAALGLIAGQDDEPPSEGSSTA